MQVRPLQTSFNQTVGPPNLTDLNPVEYSVWSTLQEKVYQHRINDLDELKHWLRAGWSNLDRAVVAAAIRQWRLRLSACVKAGGGHFEHRLLNQSLSLQTCRLVSTLRMCKLTLQNNFALFVAIIRLYCNVINEFEHEYFTR